MDHQRPPKTSTDPRRQDQTKARDSQGQSGMVRDGQGGLGPVTDIQGPLETMKTIRHLGTVGDGREQSGRSRTVRNDWGLFGTVGNRQGQHINQS